MLVNGRSSLFKRFFAIRFCSQIVAFPHRYCHAAGKHFASFIPRQLPMNFTFTLPGKLARLGLFAGVTLLASLLVYAGLQLFVVRGLTDLRYSRPVPTLALFRNSVNSLPNSTRLNLELGKLELTDNPDPRQAIAHATRTTELAPADFQGWYLLGLAQDAAGNPRAAATAFAEAVKLAPTNSKVNWAAANTFLRSGQPTEALSALRAATAGDETLLPTAFELLWQAAGRDAELLNRLAANRPAAQFALAQFFAEQSRFAEAVAAYQRLDREIRLKDNRSPAFLTQLINAKQFVAAHALWRNLLGQPPTAEAGLWNGGFEQNTPAKFNHFDWRLGKTDYARISLDGRQAHSGQTALRLSFTGRDTTRVDGEIEQLLVLRPGAEYELTCYAKAAELVTSLGPQAAIYAAGTLLAATEPVTPGSSDWQRLTVTFTAPPADAATSLRIVRRPKYAYDEPTLGTVWFDDFQLRCVGGCE